MRGSVGVIVQVAIKEGPNLLEQVLRCLVWGP